MEPDIEGGIGNSAKEGTVVLCVQQVYLVLPLSAEIEMHPLAIGTVVLGIVGDHAEDLPLLIRSAQSIDMLRSVKAGQIRLHTVKFAVPHKGIIPLQRLVGIVIKYTAEGGGSGIVIHKHIILSRLKRGSEKIPQPPITEKYTFQRA